MPIRVRTRRIDENEGGSLASFTRGFNNTFNKISPARIFESHAVNKVGAQAGEVTNDNLLPAVVAVGKPVYDTTATLADPFTMGMATPASQILWDTRGAPYQPKQKNRQLEYFTNRVGKSTAQDYKNSFK